MPNHLNCEREYRQYQLLSAWLEYCKQLAKKIETKGNRVDLITLMMLYETWTKKSGVMGSAINSLTSLTGDEQSQDSLTSVRRRINHIEYLPFIFHRLNKADSARNDINPMHYLTRSDRAQLILMHMFFSVTTSRATGLGLEAYTRMLQHAEVQIPQEKRVTPKQAFVGGAIVRTLGAFLEGALKYYIASITGTPFIFFSERLTYPITTHWNIMMALNRIYSRCLSLFASEWNTCVPKHKVATHNDEESLISRWVFFSMGINLLTAWLTGGFSIAKAVTMVGSYYFLSLSTGNSSMANSILQFVKEVALFPLLYLAVNYGINLGQMILFPTANPMLQCAEDMTSCMTPLNLN